jgi:protein required for attachment to host cells
MVSRESAKLHIIDQFVQVLAEKIDSACEAQKFDASILCADPKFLGKIRDKISKNVEKKIIGSLNENFYNSQSDLLLREIKVFIENAVQFNPRATGSY